LRWEAKQKIKREKEKEIWDKWTAYYKAHPEKLLELQQKRESAYDRIAGKIKSFHYDEWWKLQNSVNEIKTKLADEEWVKEADEARKKAAEYLEKRKQQFLSLYQGDDVEALLSDGSFEVVLRKKENEKKQAQIEAEAARLRANKARINHILKMTKPITAFLAYTLGSAAILVALYYAWQFIHWSYEGFTRVEHKTYVDIGNILGKVGLALLLIAAFAVIVFLVRELILKIASSNFRWPRWIKFRTYFPEEEHTWAKEVVIRTKRKERKKVREKFFETYLWTPLEKAGNALLFIYKKIICKVGRSIKNTVIFVIQMLKNNCPAIKWED
jgi:hypothetical protein